MKKIIVAEYSGGRAAEKPRSFVFENETIEVLEILEQWVEQDATGRGRLRRFRVRGSDGYIHTLSLDETTGEWFLG